MTTSAASGASCASPMLRDRFLNALDASDDALVRDLARASAKLHEYPPQHHLHTARTSGRKHVWRGRSRSDQAAIMTI